MRTVKLISDGTPLGTRLVDALTGVELQLPVTAINWSITAEQGGQAVVTLALVSAEVEGVLEQEGEVQGHDADC